MGSVFDREFIGLITLRGFMDIKLGKIESCAFGKGGYQEAQFGLTLVFSGKGWGIGNFIAGGWAGKRADWCKWTEEDRIKSMGEMCLKIDDILTEAKVENIDQLVGMPVEVAIANGTFHSFRILTEVL